ncbi:sulfoxide reductase heme-binding subunit YedZ [Dyadobacter jejuensis]|uniref:Sulfoxide reductase heme-binding subunit YedZ n=1 Tax=Dyadobacter jejuensis TaxID=1082580 RepID=A0A316AKY2_9BACT|nr:ferric reductase [Dyadobacter jejuensis]PWJ58433.1 sulfoxide reductase heme-binding subunit YedZ [Dyadobacter jejuensis]
MNFIKKHYGWMIVALLAIFPMFILSNRLDILTSDGLSITLIEGASKEGKSTLEMLYHISGEFAIRWMTAVLTCTPFFILFVGQAMGIATAVWSLIHFIIFIWAEGFLETFSQANYIAGFVAVLVLIPLLFTSNRKSMKALKTNWKKLQNLSYLAILLSLLHVAILEKTWAIYAILVGLGFVIRIPAIKHRIIAFRKERKSSKV